MLGQPFILQERDKQLHFAFGSVAGAFGYSWSYQKHHNKTKALIIGLCTSLVADVAKEVYNNYKGGVFDKRDILATRMGGGCNIYNTTISKEEEEEEVTVGITSSRFDLFCAVYVIWKKLYITHTFI